jgi:hypothetical protein
MEPIDQHDRFSRRDATKVGLVVGKKQLALGKCSPPSKLCTPLPFLHLPVTRTLRRAGHLGLCPTGIMVMNGLETHTGFIDLVGLSIGQPPLHRVELGVDPVSLVASLASHDHPVWRNSQLFGTTAHLHLR